MAGRRELVDELVVVLLDADGLCRHAGVLQAQGHVLGAITRAQGPCLALREGLPGGVVDPAHVRAVAVLVVEDGAQAHLLVWLVEQQVDDLVAAGGVLHEHEAHLDAAQVEDLAAAKAVLEVPQSLEGVLCRQPKGRERRHRGCAVVDVVVGGHVRAHQRALLAHAHAQHAAVRAALHDLLHRHGALRAPVAALRAVEAAQVGVGGVLVLVGRTAGDAVGGVAEVVHALGVDLAVHAVVAHGVVDLLRQRRRDRAVRVEQHLGVRAVLQAGQDVVARVHDLAVAVELVAEHVGDQHHVWVEPGAHAAQGALVALDDGEPGARRARDA